MSMTALQLAEYTIRRATSSDVPITNLKLRKTLYYLQGYSLRALNDPAFNSENATLNSTVILCLA